MIYNKKTKRFIKVKTAIKKGILDNPNDFKIPDDKVLLKTGRGYELKDIKKAHRFIKDDDDEYDIINTIKLNPKITYNNKTSRFVRVDKTFKKKQKRKMNDYDDEIKGNIFKLQNRNINEFDVDLTKTNIKRVVGLIKDNYVGDRLITLKIGGKTYTLSDKFIEKIEKFNIAEVDVNDYIQVSDKELFSQSFKNKNLTIKAIDKIKNPQPSGAFFKYYHKTHFDFKKYGIFKREDFIQNKRIYRDNCLYVALKEGGLSEEKLNQLKAMCLTREVPLIKLKVICKDLKICIKLNFLKRRKDKKQIGKYIYKRYCNVYGADNNEIYKIGVLDNHYFILDDTEINSFCLKNYEDVKEKEECNRIYKKKNGYYIRENKFMDSFELIKLLLDYKDDLLDVIKYEDIEKTHYVKQIDNFDSLEYNEEECVRSIPQYEDEEKKKDSKVMKREKKKNNENYLMVYADFETYNNEETGYKHIPYLCAMYVEDYGMFGFIGKECAKKMLNKLYNLAEKEKEKRFSYEDGFKPFSGVKMYFHNAKYDYCNMSPYLHNEEVMYKDNQFYQSKAKYYGVNIEIKDSRKLISSPLKNFKKMFKLEVQKEILPYDYYNLKNPLENRFVKLGEILKYIEDEDKQEFTDNCYKFECLKYGNVDIIKYSLKYCEMDCLVLYQGIKKFREWMYEITRLNIHNVLTISSLAQNYLITKGVFDDCYNFSGIPREFIQKCVVGGRVMCANNEKDKIYTKIADYDACSLYPSAMSRLATELGGFLKGTPKVIEKNNLNMDFLNNQDGYFIKIKVNKVGIKRSFPLLSKKDKNGIRNFINEMEGEEVYIDKIGLEDAIKYQEIEFDIIQGYYFNEGRNNNIGEVIRYLYDERKIKKKEGNPIQELYKLLMNSAYGKTILKASYSSVGLKQLPTSKTQKNKNGEKEVNVYEKFINYNYNKIKMMDLIAGDKYIVDLYNSINNHYNAGHIGCEVLSMSKRIMNEVICLAEDNKIKIYYQDTDSLHMDFDKVPILEDLYYKKYGRVLNGKDMGQFHIDFDLNGADKGCDIYATSSIFLGKKCYIDRLECVNKDGKKVNDYHIRMKGVSTESILYKCEELGITPLKLYQRLYDGEELKFDLLCGGKSCSFKYDKLLNVSSRPEFTRYICFKDKKDKKVKKVKKLKLRKVKTL